MTDQRFVDGVKDISIAGGVVRVDFFTYSTEQKNDDGRYVPEFSNRVLMSPEGFLQTFSAMERIVDQLIDKGAIKRKEDEAKAGKNGGKSKSPNF